jgi:hypothetical protein
LPVGSSWPRLDSREKVVGSTRYAADVTVPAGRVYEYYDPEISSTARPVQLEVRKR